MTRVVGYVKGPDRYDGHLAAVDHRTAWLRIVLTNSVLSCMQVSPLIGRTLLYTWLYMYIYAYVRYLYHHMFVCSKSYKRRMGAANAWQEWGL